jgi:hypothetical protein
LGFRCQEIGDGRFLRGDLVVGSMDVGAVVIEHPLFVTVELARRITTSLTRDI